jgi:hypothetical protein
LQDTPADGSAPRRRAFELKEIYGCDMLKPTEFVLLQSFGCCYALRASHPTSDASSACPRRATPLFCRAAIFASARSALAPPVPIASLTCSNVMQDCAIEMQTSSHKCPMCRQPVESLLTISISRDAIAGAGAAQDERLDMPSASQ